jgi:multidrug efflux system outer membrane protein
VATTYLLLRDIDNRLSIAEATAEAWQQSLEVIRTRHDAGMVSEVDVNQSEIQVYEAQATVHVFERLRGQTENALSQLLGDVPRRIPRGLTLADHGWEAALPMGLPSQLLTRRPDIVAAEQRLHAQTARIGIAQAFRFPQFNLLGDIGGLFNGGNTGFFDVSADMFGPLFNAGANKRRVEVEIARTEQLVNQYEQTILAAYREVHDALIAVRTYQAEFEARLLQTTAARNAAALSWVRYEGGLTSYLEVLDVQRSQFSSELKASEALQLQLTSMVRLYTALGGGWVPEQDDMGALGARQEN